MAIDMPERSLTGESEDPFAFVDAFNEEAGVASLDELIKAGLAAEADGDDIEIGTIDQETPPLTIAIEDDTERLRRGAEVALADIDSSELFTDEEKHEFKSGSRASREFTKVPVAEPPTIANVILDDRILPSGQESEQGTRIHELRERVNKATQRHYDATVVISELVTNKFRNVPGTIGRLVVGDVDKGMAIICYDTVPCSQEELEYQRNEKGYNPNMEVKEVFKDDAEHGRGLVVLSGYATEYGRWEPEEGGNCFWAILPRETSTSSPARRR